MPPSTVAPQSERAALLEFLGYKRDALINRIEGISDEQARMTPTASSLSLLSLVKHSAIWERRWFQVIAAGRSSPGEWPETPPVVENSTFLLAEEDTIESVVADYRAQIAESNEIIAVADLDATCARPDIANQTVRWVVLHMLEETAHHAGHADIIRESIDGNRWP